jgi:hypothetical protein
MKLLPTAEEWSDSIVLLGEGLVYGVRTVLGFLAFLLFDLDD